MALPELFVQAAPVVERIAAGLRLGGGILLVGIVIPTLSKWILRRGEALDLSVELASRVAFLDVVLAVLFVMAGLVRGTEGAAGLAAIDFFLAILGFAEGFVLAPGIRRARGTNRGSEVPGEQLGFRLLVVAIAVGSALGGLLLVLPA